MKLVCGDISGVWYLLHLEFWIFSIVQMNMTKCQLLLILSKQGSYLLWILMPRS